MSTPKQQVTFVPPVKFHNVEYFKDNEILEGEIATLFALNHPRLGQNKVTTSLVQYKFDDGSFETLNTIYIPMKETNEH